jgi:uncharacterized protein
MKVLAMLVTGWTLLCALSVQAQKTNAFKEDSVRFHNADQSIVFGGTLSMPVQASKKRVPAIVIVSGSGPQDRDGTMAGHKQFKAIAHYLAARGIAILRTDDRGVGATTGRYDTATTAHFAADALAAVAYLRTRKAIAPQRVGLLGHSEGGAAIAIAASQSKDVHFLISLAGLAMSGYEALLQQNQDLVQHSPMSDYDKQRSNTINALMFKTAYLYADSANMEAQLIATHRKWYQQDSAAYAATQKGPDRFRFPLYSYIYGATQPWYRYFVRYNAPVVMSGIKVPVLALNGDKDLMVACEANLQNWKRYPAMGGNQDVTTVVLPGVNHLFLPCSTCDIQEYPKIKALFSQAALEAMAGWLKRKL